jgi:hypothetical protein
MYVIYKIDIAETFVINDVTILPIFELYTIWN